ncbi:hypothetical protein M408DRAFT_326388 [Serendipita vermifera MAFF 305830]|uniref:Uncharacterized protein n=1 Tax=Serendipita vermifera MAFF 305830 TaxID=933852 RepID=A0A0C2X307_SERVB|nr:hypothetical protein M408DRAFT_326388 [Serendipita vermifera MAFF 305830]
MAGLFTIVVLAASLTANAAPSTIGSMLLRRAIPSLGSFGVSEACQNGLTSLINSPASTCLNIPGTVAILSTVENSSWIPPTNAWASTFCAAEACTSDQITSTLNTAADACSTELASTGLDRDFIIQQAIQYLPVVKSAICLRDSGNSNKLCAITTLEAVQTAFGAPLTPTLVSQRYHDVLEVNDTLAAQLACTSCAAKALDLVTPSIPEPYLGQVTSFFDFHCGANFTTTSPTSTIAVVTGTQAQLAAQATASRNASGPLAAPGALLGVIGFFSAVASLF